MKKVVVRIIKAYQKTLSPDHGWFSHPGRPVCRFLPTCSDYTIDAVNQFGVIIGLGKGTWRVLRCNPWSKGGLDPVGTPDSQRLKPKVK